MKTTLLGMLLGAAALGLLGGCVEDWVKTDVPREVQKGLGAPARVPLSQARTLAEEWRDLQEAAGKKAASDEAARREEARRLVAATVAEIEDQAARLEADGAAFARGSQRKLAELDAAESARVKLADDALRQMREAAAATDRRMAASIQAAELQAAQFGGVLGDLGGLAQGAASNSGIPGLGIIVAGVLGLLVRKPGDGKKLAEAEDKASKEWEHGYRAGLLADPNRSINSTTLPTVNVGTGGGA